jgi:hypothetical protein
MTAWGWVAFVDVSPHVCGSERRERAVLAWRMGLYDLEETEKAA